jgi:hypothetical protein
VDRRATDDLVQRLLTTAALVRVSLDEGLRDKVLQSQ